MEIALKLPNDLCERIIASEFELEVEQVTEQRVSSTIDLYVEATTFYATALAEHVQDPEDTRQQIIRRSQFYQQKIKQLLARREVQECLNGEHSSPTVTQLRKDISKVKENAPQQVRMLIDFYKQHMRQQESIIEQSLNRQRTTLDERIRRRSLSRKKEVLEELPLENLPKKVRRSAMTARLV